MLSKISVPFQKDTSSTIKIILMILTVFLSLALVVTLFYTCFQKCDRLKFTYFKRQHKSPPDDKVDTDIPYSADDSIDENID